MTPKEPQPATETGQPATSATHEEMQTLRCPTCNACLLRYHATSDLQIEIKCRACSRRERRGVMRSFVIHYRRADQQPT